MKEKMFKGAIYVIGDKDTFDMSTLGDTEGRNVIFIGESNRKDSYAKKLLDKFFRKNK